MNYIEALQALVDGKKIRHKSWDKGEYAYIRECLILTNVGTTRTLSTNCLASITDDKWEIYQTEEDRLIRNGKRWELYNTFYSINCEVCMLYKPKLCKCCKKIDGETLLMTLLQDNRISDDEVDKLYNTVKGELDA